jgi:hypothetical protein
MLCASSHACCVCALSVGLSAQLSKERMVTSASSLRTDALHQGRCLTHTPGIDDLVANLLPSEQYWDELARDMINY